MVNVDWPTSVERQLRVSFSLPHRQANEINVNPGELTLVYGNSYGFYISDLSTRYTPFIKYRTFAFATHLYSFDK